MSASCDGWVEAGGDDDDSCIGLEVLRAGEGIVDTKVD